MRLMAVQQFFLEEPSHNRTGFQRNPYVKLVTVDYVYVHDVIAQYDAM